MDKPGKTVKRKRPRRTFTPEFKAEAVRLCRVGDRSIAQVAKDLDLTETALREWVHRANVDAVRRVMSDLTIDGEEVEHIETQREMLGISLPEMRAAHAVVFSEILRAFSCDWVLDASEEEQIERALRCLDELGWAPQT